MRNKVPPLVYEIDDLCDALNVGKNTAYALLNDGEINCFKIGNNWKIPASSVEEYITRKCMEHKRVMCKVVNSNIL